MTEDLGNEQAVVRLTEVRKEYGESVALDGVSLTVNEVDSERFGVNIIPHTQEQTTFAERGPGDLVNMEIDMLARYVARLSETRRQP